MATLRCRSDSLPKTLLRARPSRKHRLKLISIERITRVGKGALFAPSPLGSTTAGTLCPRRRRFDATETHSNAQEAIRNSSRPARRREVSRHGPNAHQPSACCRQITWSGASLHVCSVSPASICSVAWEILNRCSSSWQISCNSRSSSAAPGRTKCAVRAVSVVLIAQM